MALTTYFTGTVSISHGATTVTLVGGDWSGPNARQGDFIDINGLGAVLVTDATDGTHLEIPPWQGADQAGVAYKLYQNYVGRVVGVAAAQDVGDLLAALRQKGLPIILVEAGGEPDPSLGAEEQYAEDPATRNLWRKFSGVWVPFGDLGMVPGLIDALDAKANLAGGNLFTGRNTIQGVPGAGSANLVVNQNATTEANSVYSHVPIHTVGKDGFDTYEVWDCYGFNSVHIANPHLVTRTANGTQAAPSAVGTVPATRSSEGFSARDYCGTWAGVGYGATAFHVGGGATISFCPTELFTDTVGGMQARIGVTPNGGLNFTYAFIFDQDSSLTINRNVNHATPPQPDLPGITPGLRVVGADSGFALAQMDTHSGLAGYITRHSRGTHAAPTATQNGDQLGFFGGYGRGSINYNSGSGVQLRMYATQAWTDANQGAGLAVCVTANNTNAISEVARFDQSGYLGIGTPTPKSPLHINRNTNQAVVPESGTILQLTAADDASAGIQIGSFGAAGVQFGRVIFRQAAGSGAVPTGVQPGAIIGVLGSEAYTSAGAWTNANAMIWFVAKEAQTPSAQGQAVEILTTPLGSTTTAEAATFHPSGGFTVGTGLSDPTAGIVSALNGFRINNAAASGNVLRGNGTNFVSSQLGFTDLSGSIVTSMFAANVVDTDATLAANSATRIPAQSAVKSYVNNAIDGLKFAVDVRVASTANVNIASAPSSIDGVTLSNGDPALLKNQTTASQNGPYIFNGAGAAMARRTDGDTATELVSKTFPVREGTVNQDTWWSVTNDSITIGSTSIVFTQTGGAGTYSAGPGVTLSGNQFSIDGAIVGRLATANIWAMAQTFTLAPVFTDQSGSRSALGLGTAATQNTGTSGANVPLLNGANIFSGNTSISASGVAADAILTVNGNTGSTVAPIAGVGLHLVGTDGVNNTIELDAYLAQNLILARTADGTLASKTATTAARKFLQILGQGWDGSAYANAASIILFAAELWSGSAHGAYIDVNTNPIGTTALATAMRVQPSGALSIGAAAIAADPGTGSLNITGGFIPGSFTVATLPAAATGKTVWCSNCRVFNGAGVQEGAGAGTGCLVSYNGAAWKIAGTNVTAVA